MGLDAGRGLAVATFWNGAGTVASRGAQMIAMVVAARLLGPARFGALGILLSTMAAVQAIAGLSMAGTTTKYVAQFRTIDPDRAGRILAIGLVIPAVAGGIFAIGLALLAPKVSVSIMGDAALLEPFRVLSLSLIATGVLESLAGAMAGLSGFRRMALANLLSGIVALALMSGGALVGGLQGIVVATVAAGGVSCMIMGGMLHAELRESGVGYRFTGMWRELTVVWRFALPVLLVGAASMPVSWVCQSILLRRGGYVEVALFTAANGWYGVVAFLPAVFGGVVIPRLSEHYGKGDGHQLKRLATLSVFVTTLLALVIGGAVVLCGPLLMRAYGPGFSRGVVALDLVVACAAVSVVQSALGQGLAAAERMWGVAVCNVAWGGIFVAATHALVDHGAVGLALARLIAQMVLFVGVVWLYRRHVSRRGVANA